MDYYRILGVARGASQDEIKRAYRKQARLCHPDVSSRPDAAEHFRKLTEAYGVLVDPGKRSSYERHGARFEGNQVLRDIFARPEYREVFNDLPPVWQNRLNEIARVFALEAARGGSPQDILRRGTLKLGSRGVEAAFHSVMDLHEHVSVSASQVGQSITVEIRPGFKRKQLKVKLPLNLKDGSVLRLQGQGRRNFTQRAGDLYLHIVLSAE